MGVLMLASMLLSHLTHNAPTTVVMGRIGIAVADKLGLPTEVFLMAVAVGATSPHLTPIGHQSNTLVMAPGGYAFTDYACLASPLDVLLLAVGVPMIAWVWLRITYSSNIGR
jgi:di/tricarboxylate transporter